MKEQCSLCPDQANDMNNNHNVTNTPQLGLADQTICEHDVPEEEIDLTHSANDPNTFSLTALTRIIEGQIYEQILAALSTAAIPPQGQHTELEEVSVPREEQRDAITIPVIPAEEPEVIEFNVLSTESRECIKKEKKIAQIYGSYDVENQNKNIIAESSTNENGILTNKPEAVEENLSPEDLLELIKKERKTLQLHGSNDPKNQNDNNGSGNEDIDADSSENESGPKDKYGCCAGCIRDRHIKHVILYFSNVIFLIAWWKHHAYYNKNNCDSYFIYDDKCKIFFGGWGAFVVWVLMYSLYLAEFFCLSSTAKYLRNLKVTEDIIAYSKKLYSTPPTLALYIELYHWETRVITEYDSRGNSYTRTETYKVVTYRETEPVPIVAWLDMSNQLRLQDVQDYELTKLRVHKTFFGDENLELRSNIFISRNRYRDQFYDFNVVYDIDGYRSRVMGYVDLKKRPPFLSYQWCILAHVLLFPALPYRMWMSSICGKTDTTVHKVIATKSPVSS